MRHGWFSNLEARRAAVITASRSAAGQGRDGGLILGAYPQPPAPIPGPKPGRAIALWPRSVAVTPAAVRIRPGQAPAETASPPGGTVRRPSHGVTRSEVALERFRGYGGSEGGR